MTKDSITTQLNMIVTLQKMINDGMDTIEILDVLEIWEHDLCQAMDSLSTE